MIFVGSKRRVAKDILKVMHHDENKWLIEPFAGGLNFTAAATGKRWANDIDKYIISMWEYVLETQTVPLITEEEYRSIRDYPFMYPDWQVGLAGYVYTYRGKWFGGYAKTVTSKDGKVRDYADESRRNIMAQLPLLKDVRLTCAPYSYLELPVPEYCTIYCDPPYANSTGYGLYNHFDSDRFWAWVRDVARQGYTCYVSEYDAPDDFRCIWQKDIRNSLHNNGGKSVRTQTERLWIYDG